jgi:glycosyltransferase involved in cell wall biosynthesis
MSEIVILGTGTPNSSLNSYASEFSEASNRTHITIINSKNQLKYLDLYKTRVEIGSFTAVPGSGWGFNNIFGRVLFRKLAYELRDVPIHYTTFGLPVLRKRVNDLVTIHDLFFLDSRDEASGHGVNLSKILLDRFVSFENVLAPSKFVKNQLVEYGFTGRVDVIYIPVPAEFYPIGDKMEARKQLGLPKDKILVLSVSSALKRKNLPAIKETMQSIGEKFKLVRIGQAVDDSITFVDVSMEKMNLIYNSCDVLLFPTLAEGFGKPVIEAFATGLPTVVSDIEVMHEVSGDASVFVEPTAKGCVKGIQDAMEMSEHLRERGFQRVQRFSREIFKKQVNEVYSRVENQS